MVLDEAFYERGCFRFLDKGAQKGGAGFILPRGAHGLLHSHESTLKNPGPG